MKANYDKIAPIYDTLSKLVFNRSQLLGQIEQLKNLSDNQHILICGGGSGKILDEISIRMPRGIQILYLDSSQKMIEIAKTRNRGSNIIEFVCQDILEFETDRRFDVIVTSFFFDNFPEDKANYVFEKLDNLLISNGLWFQNDFTLSSNTGIWWKSIMLKIMYLFFNLTSNLGNSKLIEMEAIFDAHSYKVLEKNWYFRKFIVSLTYRKVLQ
jgi:ubiquinone/menaquinone biosynthesis C-methylase UbiE